MRRISIFAAAALGVACSSPESTEPGGIASQSAALVVEFPVSGLSNLFQSMGFPTPGAEAATTTGVSACAEETVEVSAEGCVVDSGAACTGPDGQGGLFRGLPVYSLIGAWSTDPDLLDDATRVGDAFFVGSEAELTAPAGAGPHYLFLGENDGNFGDNDGAYAVRITQADADEDGQSDACDVCPNDPDDDADGDGVCGDVDRCPDTTSDGEAGVPSESLGTNRFADIDGDGVFETVEPNGRGPRASFTIEDTGGCSCWQIIEAQGLGNGHTKFGCSLGAMRDWVGADDESSDDESSDDESSDDDSLDDDSSDDDSSDDEPAAQE